ncbi:MAG: PAS domain S-box protein [Spirochaetota bacterium]
MNIFSSKKLRTLLLKPLLPLIGLFCLFVGVLPILFLNYIDWNINYTLIIVILIPIPVLVIVILHRDMELLAEIETRKKAEEDLKISEGKYKSIFENAVEGMFQFVPEGRFLSVNPAFARMAGYASRQEMIDSVRSAEQFYADPPDSERFIKEINKKGFVTEYITRLRCKNNSAVWVSINSRLIRDENGNTLYYEGTIEDIHARKKAEDDLRTSRKILSEIFRAASDFSIIATNMDGIITTFNRGSEIMLGYSEEELAGKQSVLRLHVESEIAVRSKELTAELGYPVDGFRVFMTKPELDGSETREWTYVHKDGSFIPVSLVVTAIHSDSGEITGYLGIATDITRRRHAEEALEKRIEALTMPAAGGAAVRFEDLFNIDEIQRLQDAFAYATGVASLITQVDGKPITKPSNFTRLCNDIIRKTEKGLANCYKSDATLGQLSSVGPVIQPCLGGGFIDAGTGISVGGRYIANWLIGQIRLDSQTDGKMREYAREIGADEEIFIEAFHEVPSMSHEQFKRVAELLYTFANQLSALAYQNVQQARFIAEIKIAEERLRQSEEKFSKIFMLAPDMITITRMSDGMIMDVNQGFEELTGWKRSEVAGHTGPDIRFWIFPEDRDRMITDLKAGREVLHREVEFRRRNGEARTGSYSAKFIRISGEDHLVIVMRDITEQSLAEEKLRQSEEKFSKVFMLTPGMIGITRMKDGLIIESNLGFETGSGWKHIESIGRTSLELGFWAIPEERKSMLEDLKAERDIDHREILFRRKDGSLRTGVYSARTLKLSGENFVIFAIQDITEHKQAEDKLHQSEEQFRTLFMSMSEGFYLSEVIYDDYGNPCDYRYLEVNPRFERIMGLSRDQIIGKRYKELVPVDTTQWLDTYFKVARFGEPLIYEFFSNEYNMYFSTYVYQSAKSRISVIVIDVTDRKLAEKKILEAETLYHTLVDALPDAVAVLDPEGRIKFASSNAMNLYGYDNIEDAIGHSFREIVSPESFEDVNNFFLQLVENGGVLFIKNIIMLRKGVTWIAEMHASAIKDGSGNIKEIIGVTRDITEQKRMEEERRKLEQQLFQSQKLDAIGILAGGIAHDFNNVLSGIFGFTELSLSALDDPVRVKGYLQIVVSAAERARELVSQIVTFSRHSETELGEITPKYIINEALKLLRASIPSTIELRSNIKSKSVILGNPTQLHQVVVNLCSNAAYAMKDNKGTIEISLDDYDVDDEFIRLHPGLYPGKHILLRVSDTGCGIQPDLISRIFEPFFTTKPQGEGTGLGLSVVQSIVKNFKGIINVFSELDKGTTFNIIIPAISTEKEETIKEETADMPGGFEKLLLLDDEKTILNAVRLILINLGYSVFAYNDSIEALKAFQENPGGYDLIITDYTMPHLTGIDIAVKMKEIRKDIPVILCSGVIHKEIEEAVHEAGISELLRKPLRTAELAHAIRRVLDRKRRG